MISLKNENRDNLDDECGFVTEENRRIYKNRIDHIPHVVENWRVFDAPCLSLLVDELMWFFIYFSDIILGL
jgi:hypothetical protein